MSAAIGASMRRTSRAGWQVGMVLLAGLTAAACSEKIESAENGLPATTSSTPTTEDSSVAPGSSTPGTTSTSTTSTSTSSTSSTTSTSTTSTTTTTTLPPVPTTTSCEQVVHIGDSTSVGLFDSAQVGGDELTMDARYAQVGVGTVYPDNDGARAIIEHLDSDPNALEVAEAVRANGYHGCWVLMVGTNDAANIAAGASVPAEERIRRMMGAIGDDPVLWVDVVTQRTEDAYRNASMLAWNQELYRVTAEYPNARVFRWYDVVLPQWFRNDGIHYTVEGSAQRARLTAQALVEFFPETVA